MSPTIKKHLAAIEAGQVTKSNVIGIRKALNAAERAHYGYSTGATSPKVSNEDASALLQALRRHEPIVLGELVESGLKLLRSPRWRKRFTEREAGIIEKLYAFALVRFDYLGPSRNTQTVPVYRAIASTGQSFLFRNVPWQSAYYMGEESGPVVLPEQNR